jgi:tetratricopeptide (TPR) repeat protein
VGQREAGIVTPDIQQLANSIMYADQLFKLGRFDDSLQSARALLDVVTALPGERGGQWRAEVLGLVGRNALQLGRLDEALQSTRAALHAVHALHDERLNRLLDGYRENLLTILAALEDAEADADARVTHRALRAQILRAQALTDRFRFAQSIDILEPLASRVRSLGTLPDGPPPPEPSDTRLWYLPRVLGLLGFNWVHRNDSTQAEALTRSAVDTSRALGDRMGERIYLANLTWIEEEMAPGDSQTP